MAETNNPMAVIQEFLKKDTEKLAEIIQKYDKQIPVLSLIHI